MGPVQSVQSAYRNYANFSGRATRPEFWWFVLFLWLSLVLFALPGIGAVLWLILWLASIIPMLALTCRRLHDTGRTGWWGLLYLLGPLGTIILYIMCAPAGNPYNNRYGPVPQPSQRSAGGASGPQQGLPHAPPPPPTSVSGPAGPTATPATPPPVSPPDPNQPRYCTQCGMNLQPAARFCTVCGKAV